MRRFSGPVLFVLFSIAVFTVGETIGTNYEPANTPAQAKTSNGTQDQNPWLTKDAAGFFTFLLVIVGTTQLGLFGWQLWLIGQSLRDAKTAADAAKEAADSAKSQAETAREEFIASHRPRIILRDVHLEETRQVFYILVNTGDTAATIVESWILSEFVRDGDPIRPLRSPGHDDLGRIVIAAGEARDLTYTLPSAIGFAIMFPDSRRIGINDQPPVFGRRYFTGTIVYADDRGARHLTVFRRIWNDDSRSFVRLPPELERDYEYSD